MSYNQNNRGSSNHWNYREMEYAYSRGEEYYNAPSSPSSIQSFQGSFAIGSDGSSPRTSVSGDHIFQSASFSSPDASEYGGEYSFGGSMEGSSRSGGVSRGGGGSSRARGSSAPTSARAPSTPTRGRGGRGGSSSAPTTGGLNTPGVYYQQISHQATYTPPTNPNQHLLSDNTIYPPSAFPPQSYPGPSAFAVAQARPKILGSEMDRIPSIENKLQQIEREIQAVLKERARKTLNNVTLREEDIDAEVARLMAERMIDRGYTGASSSRGRGMGRGHD